MENYRKIDMHVHSSGMSLCSRVSVEEIVDCKKRLGYDGAVLVNKEREFYAKTPPVTVQSTIGAGDSLIAGFIDGYAKGMTIKNVLRRAVAYGTAACMQSGTKPPEPENVAEIEKQTRV